MATPPVAATVSVPESVPLPGLAPNARATLPTKPVAVLPTESRAVTTTAGAMAAPPATDDGCTVKNRTAAGPAVTLNGLLVAPVSPLAVVVKV